MNRDDGYGILALAVVTILVGVLAISDTDVKFTVRISFDIYFTIGFIIFSVIYFSFLRKASNLHLPKNIGTKLKQSFAKRYNAKVERKIKEELETEIKNENLSTLQKNLDFLKEFIPELTQNISKRLAPNNYEHNISRYAGEHNVIFIGVVGSGGKHGLEMPLNEAEFLEKKLTEISQNKKYRKNKVLFYLFS
jgi:hypothetical protein